MNLLRNFPRPIGFGSLVHGDKKGNFSNVAELRTVFPTADRVGTHGV
jgi:hypothetical protein